MNSVTEDRRKGDLKKKTKVNVICLHLSVTSAERSSCVVMAFSVKCSLNISIARGHRMNKKTASVPEHSATVPLKMYLTVSMKFLNKLYDQLNFSILI